MGKVEKQKTINIDLYNDEINRVYKMLKDNVKEVLVCRKLVETTDIDFMQGVQIPSSRMNFLVLAGCSDMYSICYIGIPQLIESKLYSTVLKQMN
jgi:hypothetical protein